MDSKANESLTPEAAKVQLRLAASRLGIAPWVRKQPLGAMATGVLTGYFLGHVPHLWTRLSRSKAGKKLIDSLV